MTYNGRGHLLCSSCHRQSVNNKDYLNHVCNSQKDQRKNKIQQGLLYGGTLQCSRCYCEFKDDNMFMKHICADTYQQRQERLQNYKEFKQRKKDPNQRNVVKKEKDLERDEQEKEVKQQFKATYTNTRQQALSVEHEIEHESNQQEEQQKLKWKRNQSPNFQKNLSPLKKARNGKRVNNSNGFYASVRRLFPDLLGQDKKEIKMKNDHLTEAVHQEIYQKRNQVMKLLNQTGHGNCKRNFFDFKTDQAFQSWLGLVQQCEACEPDQLQACIETCVNAFKCLRFYHFIKGQAELALIDAKDLPMIIAGRQVFPFLNELQDPIEAYKKRIEEERKKNEKIEIITQMKLEQKEQELMQQQALGKRQKQLEKKMVKSDSECKLKSQKKWYWLWLK